LENAKWGDRSANFYRKNDTYFAKDFPKKKRHFIRETDIATLNLRIVKLELFGMAIAKTVALQRIEP
jgi:hypothetical protein